jgi:hypothetical protein
MELAQQGKQRMLSRFFDRFGSIPTPHCHVCSQPVEIFEVDVNTDNDTIMFKVFCHNERETATMWFDKIMALDKDTVPVITKAFANQQKRRIIV